MRIPPHPHQKHATGTPLQAGLSEHPVRVPKSQRLSGYHKPFITLRSLLLHPTEILQDPRQHVWHHMGNITSVKQQETRTRNEFKRTSRDDDSAIPTTAEQTPSAFCLMKLSISQQREGSFSIHLIDIYFYTIGRNYFYLSIPNHCSVFMSKCIRQTWARQTCLISIIKDVTDKCIIHHCWTWGLKCHTISVGQWLGLW